jgi:hypothetical protein
MIQTMEAKDADMRKLSTNVTDTSIHSVGLIDQQLFCSSNRQCT